MDSFGLRCLRLIPGFGRNFDRTFAALILAFPAPSITAVPPVQSELHTTVFHPQAGDEEAWEAEWQETAQRLFDEEWRDEAGLQFLIEISGPRVGQGDDRHDWACEVAAPRYFEVLRQDPHQDPSLLIEVLGLGRAGSLARGKLDLLAWPTLEAAKLIAENRTLAEALEHIEDTRAALPLDHPHHLPLLRRMALLSADRGRFDDAMGTLDEVDRVIALGHSEPHARHLNQRDRAAIQLRMGLIDLAAREIGQARLGLEEAHRRGSSVVGPLVNVYCTQVHIYLAQSRFEEVIQESTDLLERHAPLFDARPGGRATLLFNSALAHELLAYGDDTHRSPAREQFEGVLAIPQASREQRLRSRIGLARIETRSGDPAAAMLRLDGTRAQAGLTPAMEAELEAAAARAAIALGEDHDELLSRREELARTMGRLYDEITAQAPRTGGIGFLGYRAYRAVLATLIELHVLVDGENGPRAVLDSLFESHRLETLARFVGADRYSAEDVLTELVPTRGGILIFFPAEEGSHLLALDGARMVHARTDGILDLHELFVPFVAQLRRSPSGLQDEQRERRRAELESRSSALYERLVPPSIRPLLAGWDEIVFVGSDYLRGLPFECLAPAGTTPLGLRKAVSHVPSLPLGVHLSLDAKKRASTNPPLDLVLVGQPIRGEVARQRYGDEVEFELTPDELKRLRAPFDATRLESLLGAEATLEGVQGLAPGGASLLHIVTHGIRDDAREASRGLLLSASDEHDGLVFGGDVDRFPDSEYVILSSCASAQGPWRGGDEKSATLVGAFLRAGALGVLSSLSDVELTPTLRLSTAFQRELGYGVPPAEGLRRARLELVEAGFDDPYYFGLAQITGAGHTALFPARDRGFLSLRGAYLALALALALIAVHLVRKSARAGPSDPAAASRER